MTGPLPLRARTGDLPRLVDPEGLTRLLAAAGLGGVEVEITYVRLAPGRGGQVGVVLRRDGEAVPGYVRTQPGSRGGELVRKWARLKPPAGPLGAGVRPLPGGESVLFLFPNDARLRSLRWAGRPRKLRRRLAAAAPDLLPLGEASPLRYKPERRFLLRLATARGPALLRCYPDGRGAREDRLARILAARHLAPAPWGVLLEGRWRLEAWAAGTVLRRTADPTAARPLAAALRTFHACPPPEGTPAAPPLRERLTRLAAVAALDPEVEAAAAPLFRALRDPPPAIPPVLVHGDLHLRQVLLGPAGPVFVDLERTARGPAGVDLGGLQAELELLVLTGELPAERAGRFWEEFTRFYPSPSDTAYYAALHRLALALLPLRRLERDWRETVPARLAAARRAAGLRGPAAPLPPYEVLYPRTRGLWPGWRRRVDGSREPLLCDPVTGTTHPVAPEADPALPGLGTWRRRGRLVGYRPGRRATVALPGGLYAKVLPPRRLAATLARWEGLAALLAPRADAPRVPRLVARRDGDGVFVVTALPGRPLAAWLADPDRAARRRALLEAARALAALHALPPHGLPPAAPQREPDRWVALVGAVAPAEVGPYAAVLRRLPPWRPVDTAPVHGDLHPGNLFLCGEEAGLLDLDTAGRDDPARDAADLAAHVWLAALERGEPAQAEPEARFFLEAYAERRGDAASLETALRRSLFRLACVHRFRRPTAALAPALLEAALPVRAG